MNKKTQPAPKMTPKPAAHKPAAKMPAPRNIAMPTASDSEKSIRVRKIENGHIISESSMDKKGKFNQKETYSPTPPVIQMNTAPMKSKGK